MTEGRDHVLMMVLSPAFSLETFSMSLGSVNGPFFSDRDILLAALHDEFGRLLLALAGLDAERGLAPRGLRMLHADRVLTFTTAVRVVHRVHDLAADARAEALMAHAAGLAETDEPMVRIGDGADRGRAVLGDHAVLA